MIIITLNDMKMYQNNYISNFWRIENNHQIIYVKYQVKIICRKISHLYHQFVEEIHYKFKTT